MSMDDILKPNASDGNAPRKAMIYTRVSGVAKRSTAPSADTTVAEREPTTDNPAFLRFLMNRLVERKAASAPQHEACRAYCQRHGLEPFTTLDAAGSAECELAHDGALIFLDPERSVLCMALDILANDPARVLVVASRKRISPDPDTVNQLVSTIRDKYGAQIVFVDEEEPIDQPDVLH